MYKTILIIIGLLFCATVLAAQKSTKSVTPTPSTKGVTPFGPTNLTADSTSYNVSGTVNYTTLTNSTQIPQSNGTLAYCYDCTPTVVCQAGGTGSFALYNNNVWQCGLGASPSGSVVLQGNAGQCAGYSTSGTTVGPLSSCGGTTGTGYAPLNSPAFTGIPTAPTATAGTNTTQLATTQFVLANGLSTPVSIANGGTNSSATPTLGQLPIFSAGSYQPESISQDLTLSPTGSATVDGILTKVLPALASGYLHYNGSAFVWDTPGGAGTVTSITAGNGLTGGTITTSGTIALSTVSVTNGGTGQTSNTAHGVMLGQGTSAVTTVAPVAAGNVLTSTGTTTDPAWTSTPTFGVPGTSTGTLSLASSVGSGKVTIASPSGLSSNYTLTLPNTVPGNYQVPFYTSPGIEGLTASPTDSGQALSWNGSTVGWRSQLSLGNPGSSPGTLSLTGGLSGNGTVTLGSQTAAYTNYTLQFPAGAPSLGSLLAFSGGTGVTNGLPDVAAGSVLTSTGTTSVPAWSTAPTAATAAVGTNTTQLATTAFVTTANGGFNPANGHFGCPPGSVAPTVNNSATMLTGSCDSFGEIQNLTGSAIMTFHTPYKTQAMCIANPVGTSLGVTVGTGGDLIHTVIFYCGTTVNGTYTACTTAMAMNYMCYEIGTP